MCGITATVSVPARRGTENHTNGDSTRQGLEEKLNRSLDILAHRGPDSRGVWISDDGFVGLAHNRLSINDLSPDGAQPLHSDDGNIHAVVNGEIYDYDRIHDELVQKHGYRFKGRSDSELVVALYKIHGAPEFLEHLRGEFSFVLYDEPSRRVIAGRDRFGIKPLFWTTMERGDHTEILLAAEAKAFAALGWQPEWDVRSILSGGWVCDDRTLFKGVQKILPGYWMEITEEGEIQHHQYWDIDYKDKNEVETRSIEDMISGVREKLTEAIRLRLRADVPVGICLSGGLDSSLVAGIVTHLVREEGVKHGNQDAASRVCCFTIQFPGAAYDESEIAQRTADWLGIQIHKQSMDEAAMARFFGDAIYYAEHHNFDLNMVAKFGLSELPREKGYKVVLTGEGSDEHFAGYPPFPADFMAESDPSFPGASGQLTYELRTALRDADRQAIASSLKRTGFFVENWDVPKEKETKVMDFEINKLMRSVQPPLAMFAPWVHDQDWSGDEFGNTLSKALTPEAADKITNKWHPLHSSEYLWTKSALPGVLLSGVGDRSEMGHSIEGRPPFLDHELSAYVNALPPSVKLKYMPPSDGNGDGRISHGWFDSMAGPFIEKWILREAGKPFITQEQYDRKKHPLSAPSLWPRDGPLQNLFREMCTREAVEQLGFVDFDVVQDALETGFGDGGSPKSFRKLLFVAAWVTLSQRLGVKKATV